MRVLTKGLYANVFRQYVVDSFTRVVKHGRIVFAPMRNICEQAIDIIVNLVTTLLNKFRASKGLYAGSVFFKLSSNNSIIELESQFCLLVSP